MMLGRPAFNCPIWKLEPALKCRSCQTPRYSPPVHMIKLTQQREITPYAWVHPDDDEVQAISAMRLCCESFGDVPDDLSAL